MSAGKVSLAFFLVLAIVVVFGGKIGIEPVWEKSSIELAVKVPSDDSVNQEPPQEDVLVESPDEDIIVIEREPTIVDGTKEIVTVRDRFILGAVTQYGVTNSYDGAYKKLAYPNGDVDISTGVCTDVIVRAFRAVDIDLQKEIHRDMKRHFRKYPKKWGLRSTDKNIDHRRVPNMEKYFLRKGYRVPRSKNKGFEKYLPGDLVVWQITDNLLHIGIVSDQKVPETSRYYIIHNPFQGVEISDWLIEFKIINHFRMFGDEKV